MNKLLHVLNGDSTASIFDASEIKDPYVVWREFLCEGPVHKDVGSDAFWKQRYYFFEKEVDCTRLKYFDKTIREIIQLEDLSNTSEVVMWFDADLFCQINLLALCSFLLKSFRKDVSYYLICIGDFNSGGQLKSFSDYAPDEMVQLMDIKLKITKNDLIYADECWTVYAENKIQKLKTFNFNKNPKFPFLQRAINQHLLRFSNEKGLGQIDRKILELIHHSPKTKNEIIRKLLIWQHERTVYGFGDQQFLIYLNRLRAYYENIDSKYYLNIEGKKEIEGHETN